MPLDAGQREIAAVGIRLSGMRLLKPRQWGACWLGCQLWEQLGLDDFWAERLPVGRQGARWADILKTIAIYRMVSPGSEWRLHRHWFESSAIADLLGGDFSLAEIHRLYECHDKLLEHKTALFDHLTERWKTLFNAKFEVLLYDLTSTYFESDPPFPEGDTLRAERLARMKAMGIVSPETVLPPRRPNIPAWESLSPEDQKLSARRMEIYAAMLENMDFHIGRVLEHLKAFGQLDNTLVVFLSDNGAEPADLGALIATAFSPEAKNGLMQTLTGVRRIGGRRDLR